ncbi:MAG: CDP-diacylglycerol--glycerol-3-phosphate 3-phosphatidyltransferase [Betaproteobacteria bacterium]
MNLPNYITLLRIILIPFFINLMIYGYYGAALIVFAVACLTDALDGMIARLTKSMTELGAFLDPMADKLLIVSAFVTLVLMGMLPVWLVIIVVSRDIILVLGSIAIYFTGHQFTAKPSIIGKATTVLQLIVVTLSLVLKNFGTEMGLMTILHWTTAGFTLASGIQYVVRGTRIVSQGLE